MTTIDVHTSPLQAAREWRGLGMVAAARAAGLTSAQVEALETGDVGGFASVDEMIAAAVVYGASLGIGRDEAMALLDRTVLGTGADVDLPRGPSFSSAVRERSARIAERASDVVDVPVEALSLTPLDLDAPDPDGRDLPHGPSPEQAVSASQEIEVPVDLDAPAPWERSEQTGELEAWVADRDPAAMGSVSGEAVAPRPSQVSAAAFQALERVVGTSRAEATADWMGGIRTRTQELTRTGRERLGQNEHATLLVAIGGGALLIALMVAIGGALGGGDEPSVPAKAPAQQQTSTAAQPATTTPAPAAAKAVTKPAAMVPPARLTVNVYNAGSRKGTARRTAEQLKAAKYRIGNVGNDKGSYGSSTVIYGAGLDREAKVLARRLGISTLQQAPGTRPARELTVVIV